MVFVDAVTRLLPGALGCDQSAAEESFSDGLLDFPQYTRPPEFRGMRVPDVLIGGNHAEIGRWRKRKAIEKTLKRRPDLIRPDLIDAVSGFEREQGEIELPADEREYED